MLIISLLYKKVYVYSNVSDTWNVLLWRFSMLES